MKQSNKIRLKSMIIENAFKNAQNFKTAADLKKGDSFKLPMKRKFRTVFIIEDINSFDNPPAEHKDHVLIVTCSCQQFIIPKNQTVQIEIN